MVKVWIVGSARHTAHILNKIQKVVEKRPVIKTIEQKKQVVKRPLMRSDFEQVVKRPLMRSPSPRRVIVCPFSPSFARAERGLWVG